MSSASPSATIEPSPKKLLDSSLSSMISHRSVGGEDRFGGSNATLSCCSQVRQPKRSNSRSPEAVPGTIKALNGDVSMQLMHERDMTRNASAGNILEDSIYMYHPSTAAAESWSNLTAGQHSSDFSANRSLNASVFSFDAILPKEQTMLSAEESCTVEEESYHRSIDRFETVLLSSDRDVCRTLKPPIRQGSVISLDTLGSVNDDRESCRPHSAIEGMMVDNAQILNSGSSHQRFSGQQSVRGLTFSTPVRFNSTEELHVFESVCDSIAVEDNNSRLSEKYSTMLSNRFQAGLSPDRTNTKLLSAAVTVVPVDKNGNSRTPKIAPIDAITIDRVSPGVETVSTMSRPTTRSPGTHSSYKSVKSTHTRTSRSSDNDHQFGGINESSKTLRGSDHSGRRKQTSNFVVTTEDRKTNPSRASKEQTKSHPKSPVKILDISACKRSDTQFQDQLMSPKPVDRDERRRRIRTGEQNTRMSIISGDTSTGYASRVDVIDKANMLIPRNDSRIRPRSTNTTPENGLVATSIAVQLSSSVMQRDESVKSMATDRIEKRASKNSSRSTTPSPSSTSTLPRDKSRCRVRRTQNSDHGIDSDADRINSMSDQSVNCRDRKNRPSDASTDNSTLSAASSNKGKQSNESRIQTRRASQGSEGHKPELGIDKHLVHSTILIPSSNKGKPRNESRLRRRRASNANDESKAEPDLRKISENSKPASNKGMPRDESRTRIRRAPNANDLSKSEPEVRKTLVNSAIAKPSNNREVQGDNSQIRRRRDLFVNELKSLENSTISPPSPSKGMERDESRTRRRSSSTDEASKLNSVGLKPTDGYKISVSLTNKNMQRDESRTRARQGSHAHDVHKCEVNSNTPLTQKKDYRKEALNDADVSQCESQMMNHSKDVDLASVSIKGPSKYIVYEDNRKLVEKQEHSSYIREVLLIDSMAAKKSASIQRDESRIQTRKVETRPTDGSGESNGSEVKNRRDSTSATSIMSRKSNVTMLQITNKNKVPKIIEKDGSRRSLTKPPKNALDLTFRIADADSLHDTTTSVRTDHVCKISTKARDSPTTRPRMESSTNKNEKDSPASSRLLTRKCHTERSCVRSFDVSRESSSRSARSSTNKMTPVRKPVASRDLPSKLSLQNKDSPSDPSDSSSDPSLPDTDIDFVRLKLMAATKRQHAHKLVNEAMSTRFDVNSNKSSMAVSTQSALLKAKNTESSGMITGVSSGQKIQQQYVDSQKSGIRVTKELRNKENIDNDAKALTGGSWNDNMKRSNVSSVSPDLNEFTVLNVLDNQLKTRHLRRLIEPNDDKSTNRRDSVASSWSYQSSSYQSSSSDLGDSAVLENGDSGNISNRRLSIRQQRLPRRHLSRRIIGASQSSLSMEREKSNVDEMKPLTRNEKTDMMPQRPLRRSSQCSDELSPSIHTNLLGDEIAPTGGCEKVCELSDEQQSVDVHETLTTPTNENSNEPQVVTTTTTTTTNIAIMMNADGSMEDLFTQFSWSVVAASLDTTEEYEQRHALRNRIRHTPLHIAMERYYDEYKG